MGVRFHTDHSPISRSSAGLNNLKRQSLTLTQLSEVGAGGTLEPVRVDAPTTEGTRPTGRRRTHEVVPAIVDDGPGVPPGLQETLFYPMVTGRPEGTGLGLSIAQSLVNQHNGLIEFTSKPGETCFTILIPLENDHD